MHGSTEDRNPRIGRPREYDASRLRSQRDVIRDTLISSANSDAWVTLAELRELTRFSEASISAQMRHLRKLKNGGFVLHKRHRDLPCSAELEFDGRRKVIWEYRLAKAEGAHG
jgi:biotin operon repressor